MSDYLTDEEQMARIKSWWDENGRMVIAAIVLGVGGVIGWRWYDDSRQQEIAAASDLYADYLDAEGDARGQSAERLAAQIPDSAYHALMLLDSASESAELENYEEAEVQLRVAVNAGGSTELVDLINVRLARVLVQQDKSEEALAALSMVRGEGFRPVVAELKGDILLRQGERAQAHEAYKSGLEGLDTLQRSSQRPLLELKVADTADAVDS